MPPETNPRTVFERMFGSDELGRSPEVRAREAASRKSILDTVGEDTQSLARNLGRGGSPQNRRVSLRRFTPTMEKHAGVPVLFADDLKLMFDIQVLAMQADLTRTATFVIGRACSRWTYNDIGIAEPHHPLTHHRGNPDNIEKIRRINTFHA